MACNLTMHCGGPVDGHCPTRSAHCGHPPAHPGPCVGACADGAQSKIPGRTPLNADQVGLIKNLDQLHAQNMQALQLLKTNTDIDQRALAIAITNAEQAHMWAVSAVAKPTF